MPLTSFEKGKLKIAAHMREELDRQDICFESIRCKSGGLQTRPDITRVSVTVAGDVMHVDLTEQEVEECESIVVGEVWHKLAAFIRSLKK